MITGTDQARVVQVSLDAITSSFATVGLKMNARKTQFMVMTGDRHRLQMRSAAYIRRTTGEGATYREQRKEKVQCLKCGGALAVGRPSLKRHQQSGKCKSASKTYQPLTPVREKIVTEQAITPTVDPSLYQISIPRGHPGVMDCPVEEGCPFRVKADSSSKGGQIRNHFRSCHIRDIICIEEELHSLRNLHEGCKLCRASQFSHMSEIHYHSC